MDHEHEHVEADRNDNETEGTSKEVLEPKAL